MDDLILPRLIKDLDKMYCNIFHVSSEMCFNPPKTLHDQGLVWRQLVKDFEFVLKIHQFGRDTLLLHSLLTAAKYQI